MIQRSTQFWLRTTILALVGLVAFFVLPIMTPFILSTVLALLLWPLVNLIERSFERQFRLRQIPRWIAIIIAFILFGGIITIVIKYVLIPFVGEFIKFLNNVPNFTGQFLVLVDYLQGQYLSKNIPPQFIDLINGTITKIGNYSVELAQKALQTVFTLAGFFVELLLVPIITFYLLKDGKRIVRRIELLFTGETKERISIVFRKIYETLSGYIIGQLFLAVNMFVIVFIVMSVLQVPYPLVLALIAAIAEWIPIVGPIMGATPAIVLASIVSVPLAAKVALFYVIIQIFDGQIIMPRVFGRFIRLHPVAILGAVFIGGTFYGIKGMILAVPVTAILKIIANHLWYFDISKGELNHHERTK